MSTKKSISQDITDYKHNLMQAINALKDYKRFIGSTTTIAQIYALYAIDTFKNE
jgi:uncharacterized membrane protein YpjA